MIIDLHTHSSASDGTDSPKELVEKAHEKGLSALALTDHDTIVGLDEGRRACGQKNIRFIPGVELEITFEPGECHLLGLGIVSPTEEFRMVLADLAQRREERNHSILRKMVEAGIEATYEEIEAFASGDTVGRPHFASFLIDRRLVKDREQAFKRYLGKGRPFWAPKAGLDLDLAVRLVVESGGIPILAHPLSLFVSWGHLPKIVEDFRDRGVLGLEAWHPAAKVRACERLEHLGRELGMLVTAGSDYHGVSRKDRKLGVTAGGKAIDGRFMEGIPYVGVDQGSSPQDL